MSGWIPGKGIVAEPGFVVYHTGQGCDQDPAVLRLPPGVDDGAALAADHLPVPEPGLRVDRLADGAEQAQRRKVVPRGIVLSHLHERPDQRRRGVVGVDPVALDDLPVAVPVGIRGVTLVEDARRAVVERRVDDVGVPGHPADVGRTPPDRVVVDVEDPLVRDRRVHEVAAGRVQHAFRLGGRARGVEQVQRVLGIHLLGLAGVGRSSTSSCHQRSGPPRRRLAARSPEDEKALYRRSVGGGGIGVDLQGHRGALSPALVLRDEELRPGVS